MQADYLQNERNEVEIRCRRMEASVLLVNALGDGWSADAWIKLKQTAWDAHPDLGAMEEETKTK